MVISGAVSSRRQSGFTYLLLVVAITLLAVGLAAVGTMTSASVRHSKLQQLNWVGNQYVKAIGDYYQSSPGTISMYPPTVDDLIEDKRYLSIRRHLRDRYFDPVTDANDWVAIKAPNGGIMGVESPASDLAPAIQFLYLPPAVSSIPPVVQRYSDDELERCPLCKESAAGVIALTGRAV